MLHLKNARVMTMSVLGTIDHCDIVIDQGKIIKIGQNLDVNDATVINVSNQIIIPGIIDAHSHVGTGVGIYTDDNEMTGPNASQMDIYYSINTQEKGFQDCLKAGITTNLITPGSGNVFGGLALVMKNAGKDYDSRIMKHPAALKAATGVNPKGVYGKRDQLPVSRLGIAQIFIDYFENVKDYIKKKEEAKDDPTKMPSYNQSLENGQLVLERKIPLKVHTYQHDMLTMIHLKEKYGFDLTIDHALGASDFIDEIVESGADVIWGPLDGPLFGGEGCKVDLECVIELDQRGVTCAIMTDGPCTPYDGLVRQAGELVRKGADIETALKMITINAAKILRLDDRIGSIEVGKDADLVVFDKTPALDTDAQVLMTLIDGEIVYQKEKNLCY